MKTILFMMTLIIVSACTAEIDSSAQGQKMLAEQEAKEGTNAAHYQVQEEAARTHKDK